MAVLGMGRRNIRLIPVDNRQHMIPEELAEAIDADLRPWPHRTSPRPRASFTPTRQASSGRNR